jgi:hypothetical protein
VNTVREIKNQSGAATLVTAMALMMATSTMVLATVHAQLLNSRANGNVQDAVKDYLLAEAGLDYAIEYLNNQFYKINWINSGNNQEFDKPPMPSVWLNKLDTQYRNLHLTLSRSSKQPEFIEITSRASHSINSQYALEIKQTVRPLSILSPAGEQAPPLVLDGCVLSTSGNPDLYPDKQSSLQQVSAIWSSMKQPCHNLNNIDLHNGMLNSQRFKSGNIWDLLFSVSRAEFTKLVTTEISLQLNKQQRHYWQVNKSDIQNGRWTQSLGTSQQPVIIVFPASLGCPSITAGTAIYGIVFYESDCTANNHPLQGEIYGTMAINGSLGVYSEQLKLAHISQASQPEVGLKFPILKIPRLMGTWRDF